MIGQLSTTQTLHLIRYRKPLQYQDVIRLQLMKSTMLVWFGVLPLLNNTLHCQTVTRLTRGRWRWRQWTVTRNRLPEIESDASKMRMKVELWSGSKCKSDILSDKLLVMVNLIEQIDTQIIMKVKQSGRQTVRRLIIFRRTCTPAFLFWAYSYAGPSNFRRFGQIFWRIIRRYAS